jgi:esterase FrsA
MSDTATTLSEQLFSARHTQKETSALMRLVLNPTVEHGRWYRFDWPALAKRQDIPVLEQYQVVREMARRSPQAEPLDTAIGYHSGNWIYEWSVIASQYQHQARTFLSIDQFELASKAFMAASARYNMAMYPSLAADSLALQSQVQSEQCFQQGLKYAKTIVKKIAVPYQGRSFDATLYLPTQEYSVPTVIFIGDFQTTHYQEWRWFEENFLPLGYGMITVDLPTTGSNRRHLLKEDSSLLHQALLLHLKSVPWVDHHKVALWGCGFGANLAIRLGCLESVPLRGVVSFEGMMHSAFQPSSTASLYRPLDWDRVASLFGKAGASQRHLESLWSVYSLKNQGILAKKRGEVPMMALACELSSSAVLADNRWAAQSSRSGEAKIVKGNNHQEQQKIAISLGLSWLTEKMDV